MNVKIILKAKTYSLLIMLCIASPLWVLADEIKDLQVQIEQTLDISERIGLNNNIGNKLRYAYPDSALVYYKQSELLALQSNNIELLCGAYNSIGSVWAIMHHYDSSIYYINQCLSIASENNLTASLAGGYNSLGLVQIAKNKNQAATKTLEKALVYSKKTNDLKLNSKIYNNLGLSYKRQNIYDSSLFFYHQSLKLKEQLNDQKGIGSTTNNIALIYEKIGDNELAYKYLARSLLIRQQNDNQYGEAIVLNNFGLFYERQGEFIEALNYYERSLDVMTKLNKRKRIATLYSNIGSVYASLKNYKLAHKNLETALKINQELKNYRGELYTLIDMASFYQDLRIYINATEHYHKGLTIAKNINHIDMISRSYEGLYNCFEKEGRYDSALFYHKEYVYIKDSLKNSVSKRQIEQLEIEYDLLKAEKENNALLKENQLNEAKIKQSYLIGMLLIALLLFFIVSAFLILRNRNRQKLANTQLIKQKDEIEKQSVELKNAYSKLKDLSEFKEEMSGMIVHDLKNPINTIINIAELLNNNHENAKLIKYSGKHMLNLVMNIMDVAKYEQTGLYLNKKPAELRYIISKAFDEVRYNFELKNIHFFMPENIDYVVNIDAEVIERVFINLFTNAIKFSPVGSKLILKYESTVNNKLKIHIIDQGPGIEPKLVDSIFEKYGQAEKRNLGLAGSTGLGLAFCKMAVEAHNGAIGVTSQLDEGSDFWILIDFKEKVELRNKSINSNKKIEIELLRSEKELLKEYIDQLYSYEIFQVSEIKKVIKPIERIPISNIKRFYKSLFDAVISCDEKKYSDLIQLVN